MSYNFHSYLRDSFRWYNDWHNHPRHQHAHWLVFISVSLVVFSFISASIWTPDSISTVNAQTPAPVLNFKGDLMLWVPPLALNCDASGEDPRLGMRCIDDRNIQPRGLLAGWVWSITAPWYSNPSDREAIYQAALAQGHTHFTLDIATCVVGPFYHSLMDFTSSDCSSYASRLNTSLAEIKAHGLTTVCMGLSGSAPPQPGLNTSLCDVVGDDWDNRAEKDCNLQTMAAAFPNKPLFVEMPTGSLPQPDACTPAGLLPSSNGSAWINSAKQRFPNFKGMFYETGRAGVSQDIQVISSEHPFWNGNAQEVLFETDTYNKFWDNVGLAESIAYNNSILNALPYLCGWFSGASINSLCSGGTTSTPAPTPTQVCVTPTPAPPSECVDPTATQIQESQNAIDFMLPLLEAIPKMNPIRLTPPTPEYQAAVQGVVAQANQLFNGVTALYYPSENDIGMPFNYLVGPSTLVVSNQLPPGDTWRNAWRVTCPPPTPIPSPVCTTLAPPLPIIYYVFPSQVQNGGALLISGIRLTEDVEFFDSNRNSYTATGTVTPDGREVTVDLPNFPTGMYTVRVGTSPLVSSEASFEVIAGNYVEGPSAKIIPIIDLIDPSVTTQGGTIQIIGNSLTPNVQFFDIDGFVTNITGSTNSDLTITTVTIPFGLTHGIYTVGITGSFGSATAADVLTVLENQSSIGPTAQSNTSPPATDFQNLINGAFNYAIILVGIAVFIMIMWGGFLWLTSAANPGNISRAKGIITNAIIGAVLLISAYVILRTINPELVGGQFNLPGIQTPIVTETSTPTPTNGGGGGGGITQTSAQNLINRIGLNAFSTSADCGGSFNARQNIQDMAAGNLPAVCSPTCSQTNPCIPGGVSGSILVYPAILDGLIKLANRGITFTVTSFTTGKHATNSYHYLGRAVDIYVTPASSTIWMEARGALDSYGGNAICEIVGSDGKDDQDCSPIGSANGQVNHIHWQL